MKNKINSIFWYIFIILYLEFVFKVFAFQNLFSLNTIYIIFFSIPVSIFFYLLFNIYNEKINFILGIIFSFLVSFLFCAQIVYFELYNSLLSVFSIKNGTAQVLGFTSTIKDVIFRVWFLLLIVFIPFILFTIFGKKVFEFKRVNLKLLITIIIAMLLFYTSSLLLIRNDDEGIYSLKRLYYETHAPVLTANKIGVLTMSRIDIKRYTFGFEEKIWLNKSTKKNNVEEVVKIAYNTLDIDFVNLIANESNETIKNMHIYFSSVEPTQKNEYTGLFKGKNLIFITAEGFDSIAIDETLTPTLYKMATNGVIFNNYYQPIFSVSTSDGEYMNMNSLIPKEGVWSMYRSSYIDMPFAIGNMFNKLGYKTNAYHDHTYTYYDRDKSHPNMGFTYMGCGNGLEDKMNCKHWPNSDYEMIEGTYYDYINDETSNFATYYMTVSGHLNYNFYGNNMASRNKSLVKDLPYSDAVKAYIACNIELDKAMEALLQHLEDAGILDDTLIVMGPDHYPYGLKVSEINEKSLINRDDKFDLYKTTLIIYNPKIEKVVVDKYVSSIDILPTVYNLFGLDFDSRLFMGRDVFSQENGLVMLSDRSWITDKGKYNSITKKFTPFEGVEIEENYIESINELVYQKFSMSSLILSNDYYSKLGL